MDSQILDADIVQPAFDPQPRTVGAGGQRVVASIIDSVILLPPVFAVIWITLTTNMHLGEMIAALFYPIYKVYMEFRYGATLGKRWLRLEVVTSAFAPVDIGHVLRRNVFVMVYAAITMLVHGAAMFLAASDDFTLTDTIDNLTKVLDVGYGVFNIADGIIMLSDDQRRSLHDRIGNTLVVKS